MLITRHENRFGSLVMSSTMADCIAAGVHTHLSLPVCSSHLRLSLINLINRNHIALSVRFCVCINARARALMGAIISSRQRENLFVLYRTLLSCVASIKRKDLYRRSFNLITCRISHWKIRFLFTFAGKERYTYYEVKLTCCAKNLTNVIEFS